ncbi:hypothetical protein TWF718_003065 [Orbilia javanica]|uniref:Uncharacterized protein n=1 Tax=Orbilia javanica TaxID=47235 RepID=A0AAN8MFK2_9PEZI
MKQLLSDSEPELDSSQATSVIFTPVASDSDFDELFESESLGDRSTTSTVPTQSSQRSQRWMSISQRSMSTTNPYADRENLRMENSEAMMMLKGIRDTRDKERNERAFLWIRILLWACTALSIIGTLATMVSLGSTSFDRCDPSSQDNLLVIVLKKLSIISDNSPCLPDSILRILKKGRLLSKTLFPSFYPNRDEILWMDRPDRMEWPEYPTLIWFLYTAYFRGFMVWGTYYFILVVAIDNLFLRNLTRTLGVRWFPHKFAIVDLFSTPMVFFFALIPWESILPRLLFGIGGMVDNADMKGISFGLHCFVFSWVQARVATAKWRRTSPIGRALWVIYSLFCAVWLCLVVYMRIFREGSIEIKMFEVDNQDL